MANVRRAHRRRCRGNIAAMPEVVVVGASVAGAATAIHLARRGREVPAGGPIAVPAPQAMRGGPVSGRRPELRELGVARAPGRRHGDRVAALSRLRRHRGGRAGLARCSGHWSPALRPGPVLLRAGRRPARASLSGRPPASYSWRRTAAFRCCRSTTVIAGPAMIVAADGLGSGLRRAAGLDPKRRGQPLRRDRPRRAAQATRSPPSRCTSVRDSKST